MTAGAGSIDVRDRMKAAGAGPFTRLYARGLFFGVALLVFLVMVLVEAVFLAERFPMVFRDVLRNNADLFDTSLLFLFNSTQIFDLALALAILIAVYMTTLRMRENRELLVLFAAGTGPYQLIALILAIAFAGLVCSLTVSGVVDPMARYAQRVILFNAEFRVLRTGINTGQFYYFPNRVAFAPAAAKGDGGQTRKLFVYEQVKPGTFRVITADHARLDGPDAAGNILLKLDGFTTRSFSSALAGIAAVVAGSKGGESVPHAMLSAHDVVQQMNIDQLLTFLPRGSKPEELTIFEELGQMGKSTAPKHLEQMRLLGERVARSLLCLLAPLIALAAVCLASRRTYYFVLPLACMAMMSLNVASQWLIRAVAPSAPLEALAVPAALTAALGVILLTLVVRDQGKLVKPQLARP